mmetsp:Transcript_34760/g.44818  ORF Transcript_34760/g.44818 Transcript_34760/m.44818 type:complete len:107 (+) Transcript_34760:79-399(+)
MAKMVKWSFNRLVFWFILISLFFLEVSAAKSASRKRKASKSNRFQMFGYVATLFFVLLFAPAVYTFINALRKDPAVPQLLTAMSDDFKKRSLSFLGTQKAVHEHTH